MNYDLFYFKALSNMDINYEEIYILYKKIDLLLP